MQEEEKTDITQIDELDKPAEPAVKEPGGPPIPEHLVKQPCGLPKVLMDRKELVQYELEHGIAQPDRKKMEITDRERQLYEVYTQVMRARRVTKEHFVAALRLSNAGYEIWPSREKDLNDMKVL